jgi:hypothetical protein
MTKKNCRQCFYRRTCFDPCDGCTNFDVVDEDGNLLPGKDYCQHPQGSAKCQAIAAQTCESYEPAIPELCLNCHHRRLGLNGKNGYCGKQE